MPLRRGDCRFTPNGELMLTFEAMGEKSATELRHARESLGLTQADVARALKTTEKTIWRIEKDGRGYTVPRYEAFLKTEQEKQQPLLPHGEPPPAEPPNDRLYLHLLGLLQHPDVANNMPLSNEERTLLMMVRERNLTDVQRFRILSTIFGLLAERLERQDAQAGQHQL